MTLLQTADIFLEYFITWTVANLMSLSEFQHHSIYTNTQHGAHLEGYIYMVEIHYMGIQILESGFSDAWIMK